MGSFAIYLYVRQKRDFKKRAAQIILLEVKNAEKMLKDARTRIEESQKAGMKRLPEHHYVLINDNWDRYKHLFVEDFEPNEWDAINEFYHLCILFDEAIKHNDSRFLEDENAIRRNVHMASYYYFLKYVDSIEDDDTEAEIQSKFQDYLNKRNRMADTLTQGNNIWIYTPSKQVNDVDSYLNSVDLEISLSTVGMKLENLTKNKYLIF